MCFAGLNANELDVGKNLILQKELNIMSKNVISKMLISDLYNMRNHSPLMKKKLEQGTTLVVDRYSFSGVAFTSAKPVSVCACMCARVCVNQQGSY